MQIVHRPEDPEFKFHIMLLDRNNGSLRALHQIDSNMNQRYSQRMNSFTWNYSNDAGGISSYCVRFEGEEPLSLFVQEFMRVGWETLHQASFKKAKEEEQAYVMSSTTEDVEMADPEDDDDEDEADVAHELDPENGK